MTATPAPALTAAEARIVAAFDAAPTPPEVAEAAVLEEVARAMEAACTDDATWQTLAAAAVTAYRGQGGGAEGFAAAVLRAAAQEQRNEAKNVPDTDEGTHADGHRCAAEFLDRRAAFLERR